MNDKGIAIFGFSCLFPLVSTFILALNKPYPLYKFFPAGVMVLLALMLFYLAKADRSYRGFGAMGLLILALGALASGLITLLVAIFLQFSE